ncbi:MAG: outer membrane protein assembly factor BamA [Gammaproteobacteria bacterium]|nr:outer membrane protein assembly factor BamA [Gammaproteobacteria bacterium]
MLLALFAASPTRAQDAFVVEDIRVEGLSRIAAGTVFNYLPIGVGDRVTDERLRDGVRALFASGFFRDVRAERDGNVLILIVEERESIASIDIEGNKAIKTEDLMKGLREIGFAAGDVYNEAILDRVTQELQRQYFAQGKYGMTIDTKFTPLPGNRTAIRMTITEGEAARIQRFNIVGNSVYGDRKLLKAFELKGPNLLSFITRSNQYSREKLTGDLEALKSFYQDSGYVNFRVDSTQVTITPDKRDVYITINITEGDRYTISDVKLAGRLIVDEQDLVKHVLTRSGMTYSRKLVTETSKSISDRLGHDGYAFANVNAIPEIDEEHKTIALTYFVDPGQRVYVNRISFVGNTGTRDEVLRREMRQLEGSWISTQMVERSKVRLQRLGFFEEVNVETPAVAGSSDQVDVTYTVKEQPSGNLMLGFGYAEVSGFMINANIAEHNFLGSGKSVSFAFTNSSISRVFSLGYVNPYWTIDGVARGFNLSYQETSAESANITLYDSESVVAGVNFGVPISEYNSVSLAASYESTRIDPDSLYVADQVRDFITREGSKYNTLRLSAGFAYDTRNAAIFPDRGMLHQLTVQIAAPGGDLQYFKAGYDGRLFIPLFSDFTLLLKTLIGWGDSYGKTKELPFFENFYAGGAGTVRGYEDNSLGPRDEFGRALGGTLSVVGNAEVIIPMPFLEVKSVRLTAFVDMGNVFSAADRFQFRDLRFSSGLSAVWLSPFGLLSVSIAKPFHNQPGDDTQSFQFSFGTAF